MTIDWMNFAPWRALGGGVLIGLAASLLLVAGGRIAGVSSIIAGLVRRPDGDSTWRAAFIGGLLLAPLAWAVGVTDGLPPSSHALALPADSVALLVGGVLVGYGTRLANGCTSGHGVCGLARLSMRSLAAVGVFMAFGFITVFLNRHVFGI